MSAIKEAYIMFNGQKVVATYDDGTKTWSATTNAPANSSWSQPDQDHLQGDRCRVRSD